MNAKELPLSKRLSMIAGLCRKSRVLADVGCDHAYISIKLVATGVCKRAYAMDLRPGPLGRARENISACGLSDRIETVLCDGLKGLTEQADTILISGMGGILISSILEEGKKWLDGCKQLILQPQSDRSLLRRKLTELGFVIDDEDDCFDDGKYYQCISAVKGRSADLSRAELEFGPVLLSKRSPFISEYIKNRRLKTKGIMEKIGEKGAGIPKELEKEYEILNSIDL